VIPELFSADDIAAIDERLPRLFGERCQENFRERSSGVVRTAMGLHLRDDLFADLVRDPRLVEPAVQLIGDPDLSVQQVKVNAKEAFTGEQWQWHYDFATHHREDGVPEPLALNLHIFLDEVTEFRSPISRPRCSAPTISTIATSPRSAVSRTRSEQELLAGRLAGVGLEHVEPERVGE